MNEVEDLLTQQTRIIYCSPRAWSGLNPRKHEPMPGQDQIIFGNSLKSLSNDEINSTRTNLYSEQQTSLIEGFAEDVQNHCEDHKKAIETLQMFLIGLRIFRESTKTMRKGGILRKWLTLSYLWVIEMEKGHFTISDLTAFCGWKSTRPAENYLKYWIIGELVIEYKPRKRKNGRSFFLLSSKAKARISRAWVQSLGATYRKAPLIFSGDLVHTMRVESQMSISQFAAALKMSVKQLYAVEIGRFMLTPAKSALLIDQFYYLLPRTYWPENIRDEVEQGKRPTFGNQMHLDKGNGKLSHLEIIANAYTELKKIKKDL